MELNGILTCNTAASEGFVPISLQTTLEVECYIGCLLANARIHDHVTFTQHLETSEGARLV
jgi:hypothetical protein